MGWRGAWGSLDAGSLWDTGLCLACCSTQPKARPSGSLLSRCGASWDGSLWGTQGQVNHNKTASRSGAGEQARGSQGPQRWRLCLVDTPVSSWGLSSLSSRAPPKLGVGQDTRGQGRPEVGPGLIGRSTSG